MHHPPSRYSYRCAGCPHDADQSCAGCDHDANVRRIIELLDGGGSLTDEYMTTAEMGLREGALTDVN